MIHEVKEADWDAVFNVVNARAIYLLSKHFVPQMPERKSGRNHQCRFSFRPVRRLLCGSLQRIKGAVVTLTKAMALDYADKGIRVTAICPGATGTPMFLSNPPEVVSMFENAFPMKRIAKPEDIANIMYFLASDESGLITGTRMAPLTAA